LQDRTYRARCSGAIHAKRSQARQPAQPYCKIKLEGREAQRGCESSRVDRRGSRLSLLVSAL
jgi:hypothetical protein